MPTFILSSGFVKISSIIPDALWKRLFVIVWDDTKELLPLSVKKPWLISEIAWVCFFS